MDISTALPPAPCYQQGNEVWLVKLAGVDGPEDADALRGHSLLVRADQRPPLDDSDEFYVQVRQTPEIGSGRYCLLAAGARPQQQAYGAPQQ